MAIVLDRSTHSLCFPFSRTDQSTREVALTKLEANYKAEKTLTKIALLLTNDDVEVLARLEGSHQV